MNFKAFNLSKRYNEEWIFRNFDYHFQKGMKYAILGNNGSGKSTLLRILSGMQHSTTGKIEYSIDEQKVDQEEIYSFVAYAAPSMNLVEEFTLSEFLKFHFALKRKSNLIDINKMVKDAGLELHFNKRIENFSSGMKQKIKLIQAFGSDAPLLILDEPCSNLDESGISFYHNCLTHFTEHRITIIASNDPIEYSQANHQIRISDYFL